LSLGGIHFSSFEEILFESVLIWAVSHVEQRAVLKLLSNEGVSPSEIYRGMKAQYGDSCLNQNRVSKWANSCKERTTFSESGPGVRKANHKRGSYTSQFGDFRNFWQGSQKSNNIGENCQVIKHLH